jgi:hypothetical protein
MPFPRKRSSKRLVSDVWKYSVSAQLCANARGRPALLFCVSSAHGQSIELAGDLYRAAGSR